MIQPVIDFEMFEKRPTRVQDVSKHVRMLTPSHGYAETIKLRKNLIETKDSYD
jgi:hypothetical protein